MRILHTSDWHLGRRLYDIEREEEFRAFLEWLRGIIEKEHPDALIIAGDVFDTYTPPQWAQALYFDFLAHLPEDCRSIVVTAGNHDSASMIDTPKEFFRIRNITAVGEPRSFEEEVIELKDADGKTEALCCAVPYLRSKDLCRGASAGETDDERRETELAGFQAHYRGVADAAEKVRAGRDIPVIATGHCFVTGGRVRDDDGVRVLSVGTIDAVPADIFPKNIDYVALGHLHTAQTCASLENVRYSGAPLCMGFGEAGQTKNILIVDFDGRKPSVREIPVPEFRRIVRIEGAYSEIERGLKELIKEGADVLVETDCSETGVSGLYDRITGLVPDGSPVKLLHTKVIPPTYSRTISETIDLSEESAPEDVFRLYLEEEGVTEQEAAELTAAYLEILEAVRSEGK